MRCLKYLILETPYNFFSIFSWYFIVLHILNFLSPMFSGINNNNFSFFGFSNLSFLCLLLQLSERKCFLKIFLALIWYCSKSKHFNITEKGLWLANQLRKQCQFKQQPLRGAEPYSIFLARGRTVYGGTWHFMGELDNLLETMLYNLTLISLWVAIVTFPIT